MLSWSHGSPRLKIYKQEAYLMAFTQHTPHTDTVTTLHHTDTHTHCTGWFCVST